jgi:hypothetical protein
MGWFLVQRRHSAGEIVIRAAARKPGSIHAGAAQAFEKVLALGVVGEG